MGEKTLAEGILSSLASCQFCSPAHLSTVMSNRSVPGSQISTLSLSKWQFESQSSLQPVCASQPLTPSKAGTKNKERQSESPNRHAIWKTDRVTGLRWLWDWGHFFSFIPSGNLKSHGKMETFFGRLLGSGTKCQFLPRGKNKFKSRVSALVDHPCSIKKCWWSQRCSWVNT